MLDAGTPRSISASRMSSAALSAASMSRALFAAGEDGGDVGERLVGPPRVHGVIPIR
jgi:hypothetical protein